MPTLSPTNAGQRRAAYGPSYSKELIERLSCSEPAWLCELRRLQTRWVFARYDAAKE